MSDDMTVFKIVMFMKRRPDLTVEAFRDYYENHHAPFCATFSAGVSRYIRRYIEPQSTPEGGAWNDPAFDVITELWFDDEAAFRATLQYMTTTVLPDEIVADEKKFLDRASLRIATVVERETDFATVPQRKAL